MPSLPADQMMLQQQAARWIVHLSSEDVTPADRQAFEEWLAAGPAHRAEYERARRLWAGMGEARELADLLPRSETCRPVETCEDETRIPQSRPSASGRKWTRGLWGAVAGGAVAAGMLLVLTGVFLSQFETLWPWDKVRDKVHVTRVAEIRNVSLPDGSQVTLGADSRIETNFSAKERRVTLVSGESFFVVKKDPARPFVVRAGETQVRVIGTKFDMRYGVKEVKISVLEGIVEVEHPATGGGALRRGFSIDPDIGPHPDNASPPPQIAKKILTAGQEFVSAAGRAAILREQPAEKVAAWREGRLVYADEALREVIADANRYYDGEIMLAGEDLGDLRVTASFRAEQIEQMIRSLAVALKLKVDHKTDGRIILRRAV